MTRIKFTGSHDLKLPITKPRDPLYIFRLFMTDAILESIVLVTNCRAEQLMQVQMKKQSQLQKWKDINVDELLVFFSVLIYQGILSELKQRYTG